MNEINVDKTIALKTLNTLFPDKEHLIELRGISDKEIYSIYTKDRESALNKINASSLSHLTWYVILNEINPALYSRKQREKVCDNKYGHKLSTTSDPNIIRINWILIDCDAKRPSEISSSDEEKQSAMDKAKRIENYLTSVGFPAPIIGDSGNGYHLLYKVDLETSCSESLVKPFLKALEIAFPTSEDICPVDIDQSVFSAGNLSKLYGSMTHKGSNSDERPHRRADIVSIPDNIQTVSKELIQSVIDLYPAETPERTYTSSGKNYNYQSAFDLEGFLIKNGIRYSVSSSHGRDNSIIYSLDECVFNPDHKSGDAKIFQYADGSIAYKCHHDSCQSYKWQDVRLKFEPDAYNRKFDNKYSEGWKEHKSEQSKAKPQEKKNSYDFAINDTDDSVPSETPKIYLAKSASEFEDDETKFLWYPYIPIGDYSVLMADGGTGKTVFICGLLANLTLGKQLPMDYKNYRREPENALIISAEDKGTLLRARLKASGANLDRVKIIDCVDSEGMNFTTEYESFKATIQYYKPSLVIIDPWHAFLGKDIDINRVNAVRPVFQSLANMTKSCNCGMILISHVNKRAQGENANNAATGSADFINASRSAFRIIFSDNPNERDVRIFVHTKSNYAPLGDSIRYRIIDHGGVAWEGKSNITKQTLEESARYHKTPTEMLALKNQREETSKTLINVLQTIAKEIEPNKALNISYDRMKEDYGADIFGSGQPKRILDALSKDGELEGIEIITGKQVNDSGKNKNGFSIMRKIIPEQMKSNSENDELIGEFEDLTDSDVECPFS